MISECFWWWKWILHVETFDLDTWTPKSESDNTSDSSFESQEHEEHSREFLGFNWFYDFRNEIKYG